MGGVIPPPPQYAFMAWCSVKAQGQLPLPADMCTMTYYNTQYNSSINFKT